MQGKGTHCTVATFGVSALISILSCAFNPPVLPWVLSEEGRTVKGVVPPHLWA